MDMGSVSSSCRIVEDATCLTRLQMDEIKRMHRIYVRMRTKSPGIGRATFVSIFGNQKAKAFDVFAATASGLASLDEIFSFAIVTSSTLLTSKFQAIFELFTREDYLDKSSSLLMVGSTLRGLCRATKQPLPSAEEIERNMVAAPTNLDEWLERCKHDAEIRRILKTFSSSSHKPTKKKESPPPAETKEKALSRRPCGGQQQQQRPRSLVSRHPALVRELKKELVDLRTFFESIDSDKSGVISISEFMKLPQKKFKNAEEIFAKTDLNGDGMISWEELVASMYGKYGKAGVRDMLEWDLSSSPRKKNLRHPPNDSSSAYYSSQKSATLSAAQINDLKQMFVVYGGNFEEEYPPNRKLAMTAEDLAYAMAECHGLEEADLIEIFDNAGWKPESLVDEAGFVDIFTELTAGDQDFVDVLKRTSSYSRRRSSPGDSSVIPFEST